MIRVSLVVSTFLTFAVLSIEKPEIVTACSANNDGWGNMACSCTYEGDVCTSTATLSVTSYGTGSQDCQVWGKAHWYCFEELPVGEGLSTKLVVDTVPWDLKTTSCEREFPTPPAGDYCSGAIWNMDSYGSMYSDCSDDYKIEMIWDDDDCGTCSQDEVLLWIGVACS